MKATFSRASALVALTSACISFGIASPAHANTYDWSYTGTTVDIIPPNSAVSPVSGSGVLTTNALNNLVISMSGTWSSPPDTTGLSSLNLVLDSPDLLFNQLGNDNVITPGNAILLTDNGLGFEVGSSLHVDIYYLAPAGMPAGYYTVDCFGTDCTGGFGNNDFGTFSLTEVSSAPLPAALPLFAGGLGALGWLGRRRKRKVALATA
jgi:hypothetical protein